MSVDDPFDLQQLHQAGLMLHIYSPLGDRKLSDQDIAAYAQVGFCISEDKPLILICPPGSVPPEGHSLRRVARVIIEMDAEHKWEGKLAGTLLELGLDTEQLKASVEGSRLGET